MAIINSMAPQKARQQSQGIAKLPDYDRIPAICKEIELEPAITSKYPESGDRIRIVWVPKEDKYGGDTLWDWVPIKLGVTKGGTPSKMRRLLNALMNRPEHSECWLNDETFEYGYEFNKDGNPKQGSAQGKLCEGMSVCIIGTQKPDPSTGSVNFRISDFRHASITDASDIPF